MILLRSGKMNRFFCFLFCAVCVVCFASFAAAQKRRAPFAKKPTAKRFAPVSAVVINERLAVLRFEPGLNQILMQRLQTGRDLLILGEKEIDGVKFYRVQMPPEKSGWVQAEAVASNQKSGDDERFARLIRASEGFDQIERAAIFLENFPNSSSRPAILLLFGDLLDETAVRLTRDATRRLDAGEMRASGAPVHSYFLSYNGLDRYRRLGVNFLFDAAQKRFRYDGATWREIANKYPNSAEAQEAAKRLNSLNAPK